MSMNKFTIPPELCPPAKQDEQLLEELNENSLASIYAGTVKTDIDYKDLYVVITKDRIAYVIAVRRFCIDKKLLKELLGSPESPTE